MRLDKYLSHAGFGSRKDVKNLVLKRKVKINGVFAKRPDDDVNDIDEVFVNEEKVNYIEFHYILLNKPRGYISATVDKQYKTVLDLIPEYKKFNVAPVGRLDMDTTGVMLLTNHGALAHYLISPNHHIKKTYKATLDKDISEDLTTVFKEGVVLEDEYKCLPAELTYHDNIAYLTIEEGKYHQVKRMFRQNGYTVVALHREKFAFLTVNDLKEGEYRTLKKEEIELLLSLKKS